MTNFLPPTKLPLIDREREISAPWMIWVERVARRLESRIDLVVDADPPSIGAGGSQQATIPFPDVKPGDFVQATFVPANPGVLVSADVTAAQQITVTFRNITGSAIDPPAGKLYLRAELRQ